MTINKVFKTSNTLSSSCKEISYSFDYQSKEPDFLHDSAEQEIIEPFNDEKEALNFVNYYSQMVINDGD